MRCRVDLAPGDCWWAHDLTDPRFVARVIPWVEYLALPAAEKQLAETLCYVDCGRRALVVCTEPFCRVNHAPASVANSGCDPAGNSVIVAPVPAGDEIVTPYDYEAVVSLAWKFPTFRQRLSDAEWADEAVLFRPASEHPAARAFLAET